jgi:DNA polymerase
MDWETLQRTVAACTRCDLHRTRTQTVFGVGNPDADWMLVGEAPGAEEDRRGEPFVGRAGKLLDAMLASVGRQRDQVYIANVLKCRPPNNRDPHGEEVQQCGAYLLRQIELVRPRLLIAMGRFAAQALLNTNRPIGRLRGEVFEHAASGTPLVVTYHPAYLLRNPLSKREAWQDLCLIRRTGEAA